MRPPVVLVLRGDDEFSATLRGNGFEVVNLELIRTEPVDDPGKLRDKLTQIADLDGLFFTSPVAATIFLEALRTTGANVGGKIYVLGRRTKEVFENAGLDVEYQNDANTAEDLIDLFGEAEFKGKRLLFVRGDKSMGTIPALLDGKAAMEEMIVYRTLANVPDPPIVAEIRRRLHKGEIDWMCFFSPSGIDNFLSVIGAEDARETRTAVIGNTTGRKAKEAGFKVAFISPHASADSFATGLVEYIKSIEQ